MISQQNSIKTYEVDGYETTVNYQTTIGQDWAIQLKDLINSEYMKNLQIWIDLMYKDKKDEIEPLLQSNLFLPFRLCDFYETKVVIFTDEPCMKGSGIGQGLKTYGIVNNSPFISKVKQYGNKYFDKTLHSIAEQGVLFLNTSLIADIDEENKYSLYFKPFVRAVVEALSNENTGITFVFTNKEQFELVGDCIDKNYHHVLNYKDDYSTMFEDINEIIQEEYNISEIIKW